MKQEFEIIMLPNTNPKKGDLILNQGLLKISNDYSILGKEIRERENIKANIEFKHLHILSNEKIKKGDWVYRFDIKQLEHANYPEAVEGLNFHIETKIWSKIVATTNKSLKIDTYFKSGEIDSFKELPQIPTSFIEKYIKRFNEGNPINSITLEMTLNGSYDKAVKENKQELEYQIKTNQNNEVIVVNDRVYSRNEVETLIREVLLYQDNGIIGNLVTAQGEIREANFNQWLLKHL